MVVGIYAVLVLIVLVMWVWSVYLQRELTVNSISLNVGDSFSWVFAGILALGVSVIIASNFLPIQVWKVFLFLVMMLGLDVVILWLTATWVHAVSSHKIPQKYRIEKKKSEDASLTSAILGSIAFITTMVVVNRPEYTLMVFLFLPVIVTVERAVALKKRIREISQFDTYTEEEVLKSEASLRKAIEEGKVLKPKENVVKKIIKREKLRFNQMKEAGLSEKASDNMVTIKRKNDELGKETNTDEEEADKT